MRNTFFIFLILAFILPSCRDKEILYVQVNKAEIAYNLFATDAIAQDSPFYPLSPMIRGDLLSINDVCFLLANGRKDRILTYKAQDDGRIMVDGKLAGLVISDETTRSLYGRLSGGELSSLQSITIQTDNNDSAYNLLEQIAKLNKRLNIVFYNNDSARPLSKILEIYDPYVLAAPITKDDLPQLARERQLTHLMITGIDSGLGPLPRMEALSHLYVETGNTLAQDFLINNPQLKDLVLEAETQRDILKPLTQLRSLSVNADNLPDLRYLETSQIRRLLFKSQQPIAPASIAPFKQVRWLRLPAKQPQSSFDSISRSCPDLEVIEFAGNEQITDVRSLAELKYLRTVMMYGDKMIEPKGLEDLRHLKLLAFPYLHHGDSATVMRIRKALPDTRVLPNDGSCLGSVWLLLLIPMALTIRFIRSRLSHAS